MPDGWRRRMQHILRDNALVAWRSAIEYCDEIIHGKATLKYRKNFVVSLHNAVELFLKQFMLDTNDHRVCFVYQIKKNDPEGLLKKRYEAAEDITQFFNSLPAEDAAKFHSIEYNKLLKYLESESHLQNLEVRAARVIKTITNSKFEIPEGVEVIKCCHRL